MHRKMESDVTSVEASTPPRSPRGVLYYVQSPCHSRSQSQQEMDKMSYGSSPTGSPIRGSGYQYNNNHSHNHCSLVHHSRETSASRYSSTSLKNHRGWHWHRIPGSRLLDYSGEELQDHHHIGEGDEDNDDGLGGATAAYSIRFYFACFLVSFVALFSTFSLLLWGASKSYHPRIAIQKMVFVDFRIQAGLDGTGVPTDLLSLNSTVGISYMNPSTFFSVHVTSTPLELYYYQLKVASGQMKQFYQKRKSRCNVMVAVHGYQIPLYGGMAGNLNSGEGNGVHASKVNVALNLTFIIRSKAYILGTLVTSKFSKQVRCPITYDGAHRGKPINLKYLCIYE